MTKQELLTENNDLIIECIYCKINRLEQKQRWNEKKNPDHFTLKHRAEKIKKLAILLEWLENDRN